MRSFKQSAQKVSRKKEASPLDKAIAPVRGRWQKAVRRWEHWKLYFFLFITLPLFIVSLIVKITETLLRIKLRESAAAVPMEAAAAPQKPGTGQKEQEEQTKAKPVPVPIELERAAVEKIGQ